MSTIQVKGLADLQKFLDQLPAKLEQNVLRGALRAAAKPVMEAAKQNVLPVGEPSDTNKRLYKLYAGALRDSIRLSARIDRKRRMVVASVKAGGKSAKTGADVFYSDMVEFGTRQHIIGDGVHPGVRPRPFMRPALDSQAQSAVIAAAEYMKKRLSTKHGLNTSELSFEADQ